MSDLIDRDILRKLVDAIMTWRDARGTMRPYKNGGWIDRQEALNFIDAAPAVPSLTVERLARWKLEADNQDDVRFVDGWNTALDTVIAALATPEGTEPTPTGAPHE